MDIKIEFPWYMKIFYIFLVPYVWLFKSLPEPNYEQTKLHSAVQKKNNIEEINKLIENGADVNSNKAYCGVTPLHYAVREGNEEAVKILLNNGANVQSKNDSHESPLYFALSEKNKIKIIKLLIEKGANVNEKSYIDETPLHIASKSGRLDFVKILLDSGAKESINAKTSLGKTPLSVAIYSIFSSKETLDIIKLLVNSGANVNSKDERGHTVLKLVYDDIFIPGEKTVEEAMRKKITNYLLSKGAIE